MKKFKCSQLGKDLRAYQITSKKSLQDISNDTGISKTLLSRIRNGKENALFIEVCIISDLMGRKISRYWGEL